MPRVSNAHFREARLPREHARRPDRALLGHPSAEPPHPALGRSDTLISTRPQAAHGRTPPHIAIQAPRESTTHSSLRPVTARHEAQRPGSLPVYVPQYAASQRPAHLLILLLLGRAAAPGRRRRGSSRDRWPGRDSAVQQRAHRSPRGGRPGAQGASRRRRRWRWRRLRRQLPALPRAILAEPQG